MQTNNKKQRIAIIGAGLAGLSCARELLNSQPAAVAVHLFEKAKRAPGGRISTRRVDYQPATGGGSAERFHFDHGAQYFTTRDRAFIDFIENDCIPSGVIAEWKDERILAFTANAWEEKTDQPKRYVGVSGMSALTSHLAKPLTPNITLDCRVAKIQKHTQGWELVDEAGKVLGVFDQVVVAVPPAQAEPFLTELPHLKEKVASVRMNPCWSVMLGLREKTMLPFGGAFVNEEGSPLSWICKQSSKPGNPQGEGEAWVLHGSASWSAKNIEEDSAKVIQELTAAFKKVVTTFASTNQGDKSTSSPHVNPERIFSLLDQPLVALGHRWRYAIASPPMESGYLLDRERGVGVCGDWCNGSKVEGAFMSGYLLGKAML